MSGKRDKKIRKINRKSSEFVIQQLRWEISRLPWWKRFGLAFTVLIGKV